MPSRLGRVRQAYDSALALATELLKDYCTSLVRLARQINTSLSLLRGLTQQTIYNRLPPFRRLTRQSISSGVFYAIIAFCAIFGVMWRQYLNATKPKYTIYTNLDTQGSAFRGSGSPWSNDFNSSGGFMPGVGGRINSSQISLSLFCADCPPRSHF
jgi:hypothetical protein